MIQLNKFNYFDLTENYAPLKTHFEGGEDIDYELRPHAKYKGTIHPYIPDSFGSSNPGWPLTEVYPKLEL